MATATEQALEAADIEAADIPQDIKNQLLDNIYFPPPTGVADPYVSWGGQSYARNDDVLPYPLTPGAGFTAQIPKLGSFTVKPEDLGLSSSEMDTLIAYNDKLARLSKHDPLYKETGGAIGQPAVDLGPGIPDQYHTLGGQLTAEFSPLPTRELQKKAAAYQLVDMDLTGGISNVRGIMRDRAGELLSDLGREDLAREYTPATRVVDEAIRENVLQIPEYTQQPTEFEGWQPPVYPIGDPRWQPTLGGGTLVPPGTSITATQMPELDESRMLASVGDPSAAFRVPLGAATPVTQAITDPALAQELTYATVDPRQVGLDVFDPGRVTAAQENIAGRLERGENVAEITQAITNPELLTEGVRGGAWGSLRDFLLGSAEASGFTPSVRVPVEQTEDTTFSDLLKAAKLESTRVRTPRPRGMPIPEDTAINRLMQLDTPRIPFSLPEGARGEGPDTRQYLLNRQFGTGTETRAPMVDTFAPPEPETIIPISREETMASDVTQALANAGQPVQQNLQALAALAQTDPDIAERYVPGSQALQDITTQVESFSEPTVEWTPPKKKEVKKVKKGPTKEQKAATRKANQAANKKLLAEKKEARDIQKAKNAAIRADKLAARESAKQARERKSAEKALAVQRQHEKMARVEELKRHEQMLRFADESRKAYLARKKQEDELREAQGYGWGDMFT